MGVYRRKDSRFWWLCLERPRQRPIRESTRIPIDGGTPGQTRQNRELAEQGYAARMGDFARGRYQLPTDRPTIAFAAFRDWYVEHVSIGKRGLRRERSMLKQAGRVLLAGDVPLEDRGLHTLTIEDGYAWRRVRATQVAPSTVNRELEVVRNLLGKAAPRYLDTNPW